jgi:hypothetical protein
MTINRGGCEPLCGLRARFVEEDSDGAMFFRAKLVSSIAGDYSRSSANRLRDLYRLGTKVPGPGRGLRAVKVPVKNVTNGPVTPVPKYSRVVVVAAE